MLKKKKYSARTKAVETGMFLTPLKTVRRLMRTKGRGLSRRQSQKGGGRHLGVPDLGGVCSQFKKTLASTLSCTATRGLARYHAVGR